MRIKPIHSNFIMPTKGSEHAGGFDIYMPEDGQASNVKKTFGLGFAAAVPEGHVALILPRSGTGSKFSVEMNNTCGVIDSDYRGEWRATLRTKDGSTYIWKAGERVLQFLIVPVLRVELELSDTLDETLRGEGGYGSTGK